MKILICTDAMGLGGAETHILSLVGELTAMGHDVTVASPPGALVKALPRGTRFVSLPPFRRTPWGLLRSRRRLARLLRRKRPQFDVVHAHARLPALLLRPLTRPTHTPLVVTAHAMFRMTPPLASLSVWGDRTIAVSRDIRQLLIERGHVRAERVEVIPNGIDTRHFCPEESREVSAMSHAAPRIVFVSRLDRDCSAAARALCRISGRLNDAWPGICVTVVGGGDCYDEIAALAELMTAACGARVVRPVGAQTDVRRLLREADIFVGVSRAAMEAAACGVPVILAGDEGYGGIFRPGDAPDATNMCARGDCGRRGAEFSLSDALFRDIDSLMRMGAAARRQLGLEGRDFIVRYHSAAAVAEATLKVYRGR